MNAKLVRSENFEFEFKMKETDTGSLDMIKLVGSEKQ